MAKKKRKLTAWQRHVKSYMASHKGLSFKEALPKAKITYRKSRGRVSSLASTRRVSNPRASKKPRKVRRKVARRKKSRRSRQMTIPLAPIAGLAAGLAGPIQRILDGDYEWALNELCERYTGYYPPAGNFDVSRLSKGLLPLIAGALVHKFVGGAPLNLNRMLAAAKVPLLRI